MYSPKRWKDLLARTKQAQQMLTERKEIAKPTPRVKFHPSLLELTQLQSKFDSFKYTIESKIPNFSYTPAMLALSEVKERFGQLENTVKKETGLENRLWSERFVFITLVLSSWAVTAATVLRFLAHL